MVKLYMLTSWEPKNQERSLFQLLHGSAEEVVTTYKKRRASQLARWGKAKAVRKLFLAVLSRFFVVFFFLVFEVFPHFFDAVQPFLDGFGLSRPGGRRIRRSGGPRPASTPLRIPSEPLSSR